MAMDINIVGSSTGNVVGVAGSNQVKVISEIDATNNAANIGGSRVFCEYDQGVMLGGPPSLYSPEIDADYRIRTAQDLMMDDVVFNYAAQDTGKHSVTVSGLTTSYSVGQFTTNASNVTTTASYVQLSTYATFLAQGTQTLSCDFEAGFSAQPQTNAIIEFGPMIATAGTAAPSDGCFFRLSSSGLQGVVSNSGTETVVSFPLTGGTGSWAYTNNKKYQFIVYIESIGVDFWINDGSGAKLAGTIPLPVGQGRMTSASSFPVVARHRHISTAGGAISFLLGSYSVRVGGSNLGTLPSIQGNRILGSYQGFQGGTIGSLANYVNSTNPTAAVPTNTTAALGTGLGGQFWETVSLAVNTDGIICSFLNPALSSVAITARRLVIRGIGLTSYVQTVIVGGPYISQYSLAFGHNALSLATAESAATKAPRRIALSALTQVVTAAQAVSTIVSQPGGSYQDFGDAPIFVNPGEYVALVTKHIGTVGTSGTVGHVVTFVYGWE